MNFELDEGSGPAYRQIAEKIRSLIVDGRLMPGSAIPSVRVLARQLSTSSLTVHQAYKRLEMLGLIESSPRQGSRVVDQIGGLAGKAILGQVSSEGPMPEFEKLAFSSGVRSMASSVGDPALFYPEEFLAFVEPLRRDTPWNFYYAEPEGDPELLHQLARLLTRDVLPTNESQIVATTGSTRAISLILDAVASPGEAVLVQTPARLWLTEMFRAKGLLGVPFAYEGEGVGFDYLRTCIERHKPRVLLVSPDFGHATGLVMSEADRLSCVQLAREAGMLIIEDGACAPIRFSSSRPPSIASLAPDICAYVGSFSYTLCPGIRTGFARVPPLLRSRMVEASQATGVSGPKFLEVAFARYLASGAYDAHLRRVLPRYRARRDAMVSALSLTMPRSVSWTHPEGGFSTWLRLDGHVSTSDIYAKALPRGLAFAPGKLFLTAADPERRLRLSFGMLEPSAIRESVLELAKLILAD